MRHITSIEIGPSDLARAERFRSDVAGYRAAGGRKGGGTLSVGAEACRLNQLPNGRLLLTTYLKFEPGGDYVPLARDLDLRSYVGDAKVLDKIPRCPA